MESKTSIVRVLSSFCSSLVACGFEDGLELTNEWCRVGETVEWDGKLFKVFGDGSFLRRRHLIVCVCVVG
jgi:hypothetical protein